MLNIMAEHRMLTGSATPVNGVKHADDVHVENRLRLALELN